MQSQLNGTSSGIKYSWMIIFYWFMNAVIFYNQCDVCMWKGTEHSIPLTLCQSRSSRAAKVSNWARTGLNQYPCITLHKRAHAQSCIILVGKYFIRFNYYIEKEVFITALFDRFFVLFDILACFSDEAFAENCNR